MSREYLCHLVTYDVNERCLMGLFTIKWPPLRKLHEHLCCNIFACTEVSIASVFLNVKSSLNPILPIKPAFHYDTLNKVCF